MNIGIHFDSTVSFVASESILLIDCLLMFGTFSFTQSRMFQFIVSAFKNCVQTQIVHRLLNIYTIYFETKKNDIVTFFSSKPSNQPNFSTHTKKKEETSKKNINTVGQYCVYEHTL